MSSLHYILEQMDGWLSEEYICFSVIGEFCSFVPSHKQTATRIFPCYVILCRNSCKSANVLLQKSYTHTRRLEHCGVQRNTADFAAVVLQ